MDIGYIYGNASNIGVGYGFMVMHQIWVLVMIYGDASNVGVGYDLWIYGSNMGFGCVSMLMYQIWMVAMVHGVDVGYGFVVIDQMLMLVMGL